MIAFDTDVLSLIFKGDLLIVDRLKAVAVDQQRIPIIVAEEMLRGRLDAIRQAQAKRIRVTVEQAYELFEQSIGNIRRFRLLSFTQAAQKLYEGLRSAKIRVGSQDLRIAAICIVHGAILATRNRRDNEQIPGLTYEVWN
jgi:tRNA(fMet)-specific endonuclease VapC